jgi:hypothetical protein
LLASLLLLVSCIPVSIWVYILLCSCPLPHLFLFGYVPVRVRSSAPIAPRDGSNGFHCKNFTRRPPFNMVAPNAIQYDDIDEDWYCRPCERHFVSEKAIHAHCRNAAVHLDEWCERCEWLFISQSARIDHRHNSRHHNVCPNCQVDFLSRAVLDDHMEETYFYCQRCKSYVKDRRGSKNQALWRLHQVETHFMCAKCGTYFENQNNVDQV